MTNQKISLDGLDFFLCNDSRGHFIRCGKKQYQHWVALIEAFRFLKESHYWGALAEMGNHLAGGDRFQVLQDPERFQNDYHRQVEREAKDLDLNRTCLRDYGLFDVSEVQPPQLYRRDLIFFSRDRVSGVPYRVRCPLHKGALASYSLLKPLNTIKEAL